MPITINSNSEQEPGVRFFTFWQVLGPIIHYYLLTVLWLNQICLTIDHLFIRNQTKNLWFGFNSKTYTWQNFVTPWNIFWKFSVCSACLIVSVCFFLGENLVLMSLWGNKPEKGLITIEERYIFYVQRIPDLARKCCSERSVCTALW